MLLVGCLVGGQKGKGVGSTVRLIAAAVGCVSVSRTGTRSVGRRHRLWFVLVLGLGLLFAEKRCPNAALLFLLLLLVLIF